jgi:hypothetical protein
MPATRDNQAQLEKYRARLSDLAQDHRAKERKLRTRTLISAGGLVEKSGLLELPTAALYGALLSLETGVADAKTVERWTRAGVAAIEQETAARERLREPITIKFPAALTRLEASALRKAGFQWNRIWQHWDGRAVPEEAEALARARDGKVIYGGGHQVEQLSPQQMAAE